MQHARDEHRPLEMVAKVFLELCARKEGNTGTTGVTAIKWMHPSRSIDAPIDVQWLYSRWLRSLDCVACH